CRPTIPWWRRTMPPPARSSPSRWGLVSSAGAANSARSLNQLIACRPSGWRPCLHSSGPDLGLDFRITFLVTRNVSLEDEGGHDPTTDLRSLPAGAFRPERGAFMSAPMTSGIGESVERLLARLGGSEAARYGAGE